MPEHGQELVGFLTSPELRAVRAPRVAALDGNPHEVCVYYIAHLHNLSKIAISGGILPKNSIETAEADLAGQQVQRLRENVELTLGPAIPRGRSPLRRHLHSCINFFWNPDNLTKWAFQVRALHQAAEREDPAFGCLCIIEIPLSTFINGEDYYWCASDVNLASRSPRHTHHLDQLIGPDTEWPWRLIFANRDRLHNAAECVVFRADNREEQVSASVPVTAIRRVLVPQEHLAAAKRRLTGTPAERLLYGLHNSSIFPAAATCLRQETLFSSELAALSRFGLAPSWLRDTLAVFRKCEAIVGRLLDTAYFTDVDLAYSQHGIGHVTRVMFWTVFLARWCGLDGNALRNSVLAAFLHDLSRENQRADGEHGETAANSALTAEILGTLGLAREDQYAVREAVRLHSVEHSGQEGSKNLVVEVLRNADALERGRFGKPWSPTGCDPRRLTLSVFQAQDGAAEALASIAHRIALFTRYENWAGNTYDQLVQRIASALGACVHHGLLTGAVKETAKVLLDPTATEPEPRSLVEIPLSGGMIPRYAYAEPVPPAQCPVWQQHGSALAKYTLAMTASCEWEDSPVACVLENIITRGTPHPASRYVTEAASGIRRNSHTPPADIAFTAAVHQIQRTLTHLMAGQALPVDAPEWRIALTGLSARFAYMAVVDFYRLLRAVRVLQAGVASAPAIDLLLPPGEAPSSFKDEEGVKVHTSPSGRYGVHVEFRGTGALDLQSWTQTPRCIHRAVIKPDAERKEAVRTPLRSSNPIQYAIDLQNAAHIEALSYLMRNIFWKEEFRPGQLEVIARALQRQDVIALLPTGAGKSLTYQLTSLLQPGLTIVVDPLKSLMRDQDKSLKAYGIDRSVFINSSLNTAQIADTMNQVAQGWHQFVFVSPERLLIKKFRHMLRSMQGQVFAYCVVDEAHCVSEWGHDFRIPYLRLGDVARRFCPSPDGNLPIVALTGTASYDVLRDVQIELNIPNSEALVRPDTYEREELHFDIVKTPPPAAGPGGMWARCSSTKRTALRNMLADIPSHVDLIGYTEFEKMMVPNAKPPSAGLVFCPHKAGPFGAQTVAAHLTEAYPALAPAIGTYHGADDGGDGMDDAALQQMQIDFMSGRKSLLACTKAFGMGIDKPNIRFTIHFAMPQSIEAFYQEAGRAGRDRKKAYCGLIYTDTDTGHDGPMDMSLLESFHKRSFPNRVKDASGLSELLLGSQAFRDHGDTWVGLETVARALRPGEGKAVQIPFENYGLIALAQVTQEAVHHHVSVDHIRAAIPYSGDAENFTWRLAHNLLGDGHAFAPATKTTLQALYNATRQEQETFRAVYRLLVLGLLEDYVIEYGAKEIHATLIRLDDRAIKTNLINYLTRYLGRHDRRVRHQAIDERRGQTVLQKCCGHLLDFVYSEIAAKRHSAMQNMESAVRGGLQYGIDEFARRVNTYFDSRFTNNILDDIHEKPIEEIIETYIKKSKGRPDDVEHLWGSCDRLVETNPSHAGLFLLRAFAHWVTSRSLHDASRDARKGYEILVADNNWQPRQLVAFQARYIGWIEEVNPDAANFARADIIGTHIDVLSDFATQILGKG